MSSVSDQRPIFVYGTLRDPDILAVALGDLDARVSAVPAALADHTTFAVAGGAYPALRYAPGEMQPGVLLSAGAEVRRALDFFEGAFDYALEEVVVEAGGRATPALVYRPGSAVQDDGIAWKLEDWAARHKPLFLEVGREVMARRLTGIARSGALRRAAARARAAVTAPAGKLRRVFGPDDVQDHKVERLRTGFFAFEAHEFRHRRFDGGLGPSVRREVLVTGDAVSVLPWDPVSDRVLLIEQIRSGLVARGEANPWNLEVVAGLIDGQETPETTARREAEEEAGITLGRLHRIAEFYPSVGAVTEYVYSFIAEADLSAVEPGTHGLASEAEDIRTMIIDRTDAVAALASGEARNAPLVISLMALETCRGRLLAEWVGGVAAPERGG